jgi:hypothetical protein
MEVFIKIEFGDPKTLVVIVEADDTINMVKGIMKNMEGIPKHEQILKFADETLEDDRTISDYNITEGDTIHLVILTEFDLLEKGFLLWVLANAKHYMFIHIYIYIHISLC